jgi:Integrase core domain
MRLSVTGMNCLRCGIPSRGEGAAAGPSMRTVSRPSESCAETPLAPGADHREEITSYRVNEFYRVAFSKKVYRSTDELQADLDAWIKEYNEARPHQGRWCFGKTPMQTFLDAMPMTKEKMIAA